MTYPRDLIGHGRRPPHPRWPNGARLALQFVLNHEEGAENCVLDGDSGSETFLSEIIGAAAYPMRHMSMESLFEYGSRAGLWRVLRAFEQRGLPLTVFAVARALQRHPEAAAAYRELGHEIAAHGLRWISYQQIDEATEREHIAEAVAILKELTGVAPLGWYTGRDSPNTRRLVIEHGGFLYDSDSYADDLPYWIPGRRRDQIRRIWSFLTRWTATTCASRRCRASTPAASSSTISRIPSMCCTGRATRSGSTRPKCCRWGCTHGCAAARAASRRWSGSWIMSAATSACGSAGGSTLPGTGSPRIRPPSHTGVRRPRVRHAMIPLQELNRLAAAGLRRSPGLDFRAFSLGSAERRGCGGLRQQDCPASRPVRGGHAGRRAAAAGA